MTQSIDKWHAECLPCKWVELYDDQESAIAAVESHVRTCPLKLNNVQRGEQHAGHVQCRTIGAPEFAWDRPQGDQAVRLPSFPGDGAANLPAPSPQPVSDAPDTGSEEE